jgi:hypothetical protein
MPGLPTAWFLLLLFELAFVGKEQGYRYTLDGCWWFAG